MLSPLALAADGFRTPAAAAERKPNVVLIVASDWRGQSVPWAGDQNAMAPNLTRLGEQSLTFSRAYSCISRTDRAFFCLFRGVFPHTLGAPTATLEELASESPSLQSLLGSAGYRTARFDSSQTEEIVSFVHATSRQPFFIEWTFANQATRLMERVPLSTLQLPGNTIAQLEEKTRLELATFYARARTRDREIGIVLQSLDRPGVADNTIFVFTSDHGEQYGSHGYFGDDYPYEECMRIPLAVRYPRVLPAGKQSDVLVSQADILPSLLSLCGVAIPSSAQGRDLSAVWLGKSAERPDSIYAEGRIGHPDEWRMLVRGYDKIVAELDGKVTHLFNLADDPNELTNLANVASAQLKQDSLLALQKVWARKLGDGVDASGLRKR